MSSTTITPTPARRATLDDGGSPEPVTVRSLNYAQLRLICESAAGIPALGTAEAPIDDVVFVSDADGLRWVAAGDAVSDDVVRVPARIGRKFPALWSVELGMHPAPARASMAHRRALAGAAAREGAVNAVDVKADAVFWSDAAVRKFVFPYAASCGGYELLHSLHNVWTCYPSAHCRVVALMHVTAQQSGVPLSLNDAFMIVFSRADSDRLEALTLGEFLGLVKDQGWRFDEPPSLGSPPALYPAGSVNEYLDYGSLRAIAEAAESTRAGTEYFVVASGAAAGTTESAQAALGDPTQLVIPACTYAVPADRRVPGAVGFQVEQNGEILDVATAADALFWSTGAIEQFMFPYYASKRGLQSPTELQDIRSAWDDPGYVEPQEPLDGAAVSASASAPPQDDGLAPADGTAVYGLVHIPRSLWVTPEEALQEAERQGLRQEELNALAAYLASGRVHWASALREVGVLHGPAGARPRLLPLDEFRVLYPGRFA